MKLHLPTKLFRALMALMLTAPSLLQAAYTTPSSISIPLNYVDAPVSSLESVLAYDKTSQDVAFRLVQDISYKYEPDALNPFYFSVEDVSGSWLFTSGSVSNLRSLSFCDSLLQLFNFETESGMGNVEFANLHTLKFDTNTYDTPYNTMEGAVIRAGGVALRNNYSVNFIKNSINLTHPQGSSVHGGAICAEELAVVDNDHVAFCENSAYAVSSSSSYGASAAGGAVYGEIVTLSGNEQVEFIKNEAYAASRHSAYANGGAICATSLFLTHNGDVTFSENSVISSDSSSGGALSATSVYIAFNRSLTFRENGASLNLRKGGAINTEVLQLRENASVTFADNVTSDEGGAIYSDIASINDNQEVIFRGNKSVSRGGAMYAPAISLSYNDKLIFESNSIERTGDYAYGGAISGDSLELIKNGDIRFHGNSVVSQGGDRDSACGGAANCLSGNSMVISRNRSVSLSGNKVVNDVYEANGGALFAGMESVMELCYNGDLFFSGNSASGSHAKGGAIYSQRDGVLKLENNGTVAFIGNYVHSTSTYSEGGAICSAGSLYIRNNDSVEFEKNLERTNSSYLLRGLHAYGEEVCLSAPDGKHIEFRDSFYLSSDAPITINADYTDVYGNVYKQKGSIILSGAYTEAHLNEVLAAQNENRTATEEEVLNSNTSEARSPINLCGGELRVEDGATLLGEGIMAMEGSGAILHIRNATLLHGGYEVDLHSGSRLKLSGTNTLSGNVRLQSGSGLELSLGHTVLFGDLSMDGNLTLSINADGVQSIENELVLFVTGNVSGWDASKVTVVGGAVDKNSCAWVDNGLILNYNPSTYTKYTNGSQTLTERHAGNGIFSQYKELSFENARYTGSGGALNGCMLALCSNGSLKFIGNIVEGDDTSTSNGLVRSTQGGAIYSCSYGTIDGNREYGIVALNNNADVIISRNKADDGSRNAIGGAVSAETLTLLNNDAITISENSTTAGNTSRGGALAVHTLSVNNNGIIDIQNNYALSSMYASGGAIYVEQRALCEFCENTEINFSGNKVEGYAGVYGGGIYADDMTLSGNVKVEFSGNSAVSLIEEGRNYDSRFAGGGAIYGADVILNENKTVIFSGNTAQSPDIVDGASGASGGAVSGFNIRLADNEKVELLSNAAIQGACSSKDSYATGGALIGRGGVQITGNDTVLIQNNLVSSSGESILFAGGGAIASEKNLEVQSNGTVAISGNKVTTTAASTKGGAIYAVGNLRICNNDSVVFEKNAEVLNGEYRLRSIWAESESKGSFTDEVDLSSGVSLSAAQGESIVFKDSVYVKSSYSFKLNQDYVDVAGVTHQQKGTIVFTGAFAEKHLQEVKGGTEGTESEILSSRISEILATTKLFRGCLSVEDHAVYSGQGITTVENSAAIVRLSNAEMSFFDGYWMYQSRFNRGTGLDLRGRNKSSGLIDMDADSALTFHLASENLTTPVLSHTGAFTFNGALHIQLNHAGEPLTAGQYKLLSVTESVTGWSADSVIVNGGNLSVSDLAWVDGTLCFTYSNQSIQQAPATPVLPSSLEIPEEFLSQDDTLDAGTDMRIFVPADTTIEGKSVDKYTQIQLTNQQGEILLKEAVVPGSVIVDIDQSLVLKSDSIASGYFSGEGSLIKSGAGHLTIDADNTQWSGQITLNGGTLRAGCDNALGLGNVIVSNGARLELADKEVRNDIILSGDAVITGGSRYSGELTMKNGELLPGSVLNIAEKAILTGGLLNGELRGSGEVEVIGKVVLGNNGTIATRGLDVSGQGGVLYVGAKGMKSQSKGGALSLRNGGSLISAGNLTIDNLNLDGGRIYMTGSQQHSITVRDSLTLNGRNSLNLGFSVSRSEYESRKAFKIVLFSNLDATGDDLYSLLGLSEDLCTLDIDWNSKAITLVVKDRDAWNAQAADVREENENSGSTDMQNSVSSISNHNTEEYRAVADGLVQANWGQLEASRAFANAIANRSMAVQLGRGERAVWASAIGGSSRHSSAHGHAGADTNISGGAFGLETQVGRASLFGLALGNSWTRVSAHGFDTIKQDTTHLGIYGQTNWRKVSADWSAAYGRSESEVMGSDWNQKHLQLDGRVSYNHELSERTVLRSFGGMQYYASDSASVNGIDTGSLQNLRAEIGVGASHRVGRLSLYGEAAVHQDLVRHNPKVSMEGLRFGGMNPGRTGLNFTVGASYELNDKWSLNASYTGEVVENANAHSANIGATYKF